MQFPILRTVSKVSRQVTRRNWTSLSTMPSLGVTLPNGCRIVHGAGSNIKKPFADLPSLRMTELELGVSERELATTAGEDYGPRPVAYQGQLGFIPFDTTVRLPRHVHISMNATSSSDDQENTRKKLLTERILVLSGVALVQLNGFVYVIPSNSLVTIGPGVPHTWTACPAGVKMPNGEEVSNGTFFMVYEYEAPSAFFATDATETLRSVDEYVEYKGSMDAIRFPKMSVEQVVKESKVVWGKEVKVLESQV